MVLLCVPFIINFLDVPPCLIILFSCSLVSEFNHFTGSTRHFPSDTIFNFHVAISNSYDVTFNNWNLSIIVDNVVKMIVCLFLMTIMLLLLLDLF